MPIVALDIGGANLKVAHERAVLSRPFALWRAPQCLADELCTLLEPLPPAETALVTMTAELCDCFETKAEGVRHVLEHLQQAFRRLGNSQVRTLVWTVDGQFVELSEAMAEPARVAAANWLAAATWAAGATGASSGIWVDVGSTTVDLVLFEAGCPRPLGYDDLSRLVHRELLYFGVRRTPVAMVVDHLPLAGRMVPVARELFATTADVFVMTGHLPEEPHRTDTADGRPLTRRDAARRLARMLCADSFEPEAVRAMAEHVAHRMTSMLADALHSQIRRLQRAPEAIVVSGEGEFLVEAAARALGLGKIVKSVSATYGRSVSTCLPAWALLRLYEAPCRGPS